MSTEKFKPACEIGTQEGCEDSTSCAIRIILGSKEGEELNEEDKRKELCHQKAADIASETEKVIKPKKGEDPLSAEIRRAWEEEGALVNYLSFED